MEELSVDEVRARTFRVTRRGFDQDEVNGYLEEMAGYLEALQQRLYEAGVTDVGLPHDLSAEYAAVGNEVATVLAEARAVADAMRSRAAADVARWRADAEAETEQARAETAKAIRQVRQSVWETGTEMLEQVMAEGAALLADVAECLCHGTINLKTSTQSREAAKKSRNKC